MKSRRLLVLGAAIAAAAVVAVVLIVVATSGSSKPKPAATTTAATGGGGGGPSGPTALFAGIPQHGDTLGRADAPASMLVFEDPQCPYCQEWNNDTLPAVVDQFVRTGKLKLVYRGIAVIGPNSVKGLRAVFAAGQQDKLWNFSDAMYQMQGEENSGWITNEAILGAAKASGANGAAILAASPSKAVTAQLRLAATEAQTYQVQGTPTFVIEQPPSLPQQLSVTSLEPDQFTADLQSALQ
ncbi:MAG TPA: thioredoxin domain-containing protein [Gaiellaceae bacterium]